MNAIHVLSAQPWVERLGWTLVHFLWQGTLIAVLYAAARSAMLWTAIRRTSANARYRLACAALASMIAAPLVTWELLRPPDTPSVAVNRTATVPRNNSTFAVTALPAFVRATVSSKGPAKVLPWVVVIWLLGATVLWVRLAGGWMVAARMQSIHVRLAPQEWQQALRKLAARIGLARSVRLLVSALVEVPTVIGWLRPVLLVPVGALTSFPAEQLELLLLHELAHIRRHDYLVNIVQSVAEALLFYHPTVWWVSGHIRNERELCCDDLAVSMNGDVLTYARALAELESCRPVHFNAMVAANGGSLVNRIARLLGDSRPADRSGLVAGLAMSAVLLFAAYGLYAQSETKPAFAVASIKRNTSGVPFHRLRALPGAHLSGENAPLMMLMQNAYSVQAYQIVGGPTWINTEGFDIDAKPEGQVDQQKVWPMLQALLADRFKLTLHRETRELPVFALTLAKGGIKTQSVKEGSCPPREPGLPPPPSSTIPCGMIRVSMGAGAIQMEGTRIPIAEFVRILAGVMGRPVIDRTGFTGELEVHLQFLPDESTLGMPRPGGPAGLGPDGQPQPHTTDSNIPSIFAAIQEQLGVKLESAKGPVEVLVIDHVERPNAN